MPPGRVVYESATDEEALDARIPCPNRRNPARARISAAPHTSARGARSHTIPAQAWIVVKSLGARR